MNNTANVIIVGGGIAGVCAMYYLVHSGLTDVILLEKDRIGSGTTGYSAAYVCLQECDLLLTKMSQISFPEFMNFKEIFGSDLGYLKKGSISIDVKENDPYMLERARKQNTLGVKTELVSQDGMKTIAPFLNTSDLGTGLLCEWGGSVDTNILMREYIKQSQTKGARVHEHCQATGLDINRGRIRGVHTTEGYISAPIFINAAGIYAKNVASWAGLSLPLRNSLRHNITTEHTSRISDAMPMLEVLGPLEMYIEGKDSRVDFALGDDTTNGYDHIADADMVFEKYGDAMAFRMPDILDLKIKNIIAGIRSMTPDYYPIIGPVEEVEGFYNDCGWDGNGISLGPFGGKVIADLITGQKTLSLDLNKFSHQRFV